MVVLYQSQTYPVNPPSASPVLTLTELWQVMLLKCRKPQLVVAPITACEVVEETDTFMKRVMEFQEVNGSHSTKVTEELDIRAPWKFLLEKADRLAVVASQVDFRNLTSGGFISNTVSQGENETDLYLTFYFDWPYPNVQEGSEEAEKLSEQLWALARKTVQHTIDFAREMKSKGELQN